MHRLNKVVAPRMSNLRFFLNQSLDLLFRVVLTNSPSLTWASYQNFHYSPSVRLPTYSLSSTLVAQLLSPHLQLWEKNTVFRTGKRLGKPQHYKLIP
jgi:hypothetical protein